MLPTESSRLETVTESGGDCYARCVVRSRELFMSMDIIRQAIRKIPNGPIDVKVTGTPNGEYFTRAEQPRGELVHYIKGNGTKFLVRSRIRTPDADQHSPAHQDAPGVRARRCPGHRVVHRSLHQLYGAVSAMAFFEMVKTALRTVVNRPATILYPAEPAKKTPSAGGT